MRVVTFPMVLANAIGGVGDGGIPEVAWLNTEGDHPVKAEPREDCYAIDVTYAEQHMTIWIVVGHEQAKEFVSHGPSEWSDLEAAFSSEEKAEVYKMARIAEEPHMRFSIYAVIVDEGQK